LAEQAKILVAEGEENNLFGTDKFDVRWARWHHCGMCEQQYHGVVMSALGWACWKTYLGRPETDQIHGMAMNVLGNGLSKDEEALTVKEAELSMLRRVGAPVEHILGSQSNLAMTYRVFGQDEQALDLQREVYSVCLRLFGEHLHTLLAANNYASTLVKLRRYQEARSLLRKTMPAARRVLGEIHDLTLKMMMNYGGALYKDPDATLDDLREAVKTLEDTERIARRVLGGVHPDTVEIEGKMRDARAALRARETPEVLQTADDLAARFGGL
jgi:hypothetical protein